ncbi:unnamed protein product [Rotaria sp. Silwood2]|nr:unnamed protein product [Rotaria sp. Silwood2]CAF3095081.1 unnamed protein product [Rotaria sp. Silwood2]CAF3177768.1 unnamed protein product [Rotaria sp. Silwood2]CAF4339363.1 unnamed protein product [Rotaria sp. Silwood2]CAF4386982.1 unnamed protein product [Rotaria sp. Silwood2]
MWCAQQCSQNVLCRVFVYNEITLNCQLYQSDLSSGNITSVPGSTSRVGRIRYQPQLYLDYNRTCDRCQVNRYLTCQNAKCQCPPPTTFWNGQLCQNQLSYGKTCNSSSWCRQDWNLTCVFRSCQPNTAICKLGATAITFDDDILSMSSLNGFIPSSYQNLSWTNAKYLNATGLPTSGYRYVCVSGEYICWFNAPMTIETLIANRTFTINSFVTAAGWYDSVSLSIIGYFSSTQMYTTTLSLNTYTQRIIELNWSGITKVVFNPSGSGYYDTGIDNLCITF